MPLGRAVPYLLLALTVLAACTTVPGPEPSGMPASMQEEGARTTARMPRELQFGGVDMIIQRVEPDVSREEVMAAIGPMIANAPVCLRWPALWMEQARRTSFSVRYDLMTRDWGEAAVAAARARMAEFVDMGLLQEQAGAYEGTVVYVVTSTGLQFLRGVVEPGARPTFCGPAERRLVAIEALEWGQFPCGTLRVRFTHEGDAWPSWATSEHTRARLAPVWPAAGAPVAGSVSLSRQWFAREALPPGAQNGALRSACFDARRQEIIGDDLNLSLGGSN